MKTILKPTLLILVTFFLSFQAEAQNMVGMTKAEVQKKMASDFPRFETNAFGISTNINTLKYVDKNDRTLIFYFGKDNKCEYSKMIEDMDVLQKRIVEFNAKYKHNGELKWIENTRGKNYNIKIEKEEYIFNVIITE
jgi:hypothetical protein